MTKRNCLAALMMLLLLPAQGRAGSWVRKAAWAATGGAAVCAAMIITEPLSGNVSRLVSNEQSFSFISRSTSSEPAARKLTFLMPHVTYDFPHHRLDANFLRAEF